MKEASPIIIVVEDEVKIRRFVRMSLESEGCQVYEADCVKGGQSATAKE